MIPVLRRELVAMLRSPRSLAAVVVAAVVFALLVLSRWPGGGVVDLSGAASRGAFRVFAYGLLGGVLLLVPAFPATSIVRERIQGTLLLLLNAPLRPAAVYAGKFLAVLAFAALVLCTSLPAAAGVYAMGGVDPVRQIGVLYLILAVVAVECIAIGLLVSAHAASPDAAVRTTYAAVFGACFASLGPYAVLQGKTGLLATAAEWLRRLSPLPPVMRLVGHGTVGTKGMLESGSGIPEFLLAAGVFVAVLVAAAVLQLNHRIFDRARDQGRMTDEQSIGVRTLRRLMFLVDPQRRKAGIPFFLNPVMVKEFRTRRFGRFHWLLRLAAGCAVVSLLLTLAATTSTMDWGVESVGGLLVILQVALVVLLTPSLAAGLVSTERESGGWSLLQATPMSGLRIATGKLASVVWTMLLVLAATLPGYGLLVVIKPDVTNQVSLAMVCVLLAVASTIALSAAIGSFMARTATATVTAYVVVMALYLGPLLVWAFREDPFGHRFVESALTVTPLAAALGVIETAGFESYVLIPVSWWIAAAVCLVSLAAFGMRIWRLLRPE